MLREQLREALQEAREALEGMTGGGLEESGKEEPIGLEAHSAAADLGAGSAAAAPPAQPASQPRTAQPGTGNARIHPASRYALEQPDFAALAARYPALRPHLRWPGGAGQRAVGAESAGAVAGSSCEQAAGPGRPTINFGSTEACRALTAALLDADFGIVWDVPPGQLVPPLTNRANYIHWLEDLLALSAPPGEVVGLDIGCGANLIYPLLGAAIAGWRFVAADVTSVALAWAARNREANSRLAPLIDVRRVAMQPEQRAFHRRAAAADAAGADTAGADVAGADAVDGAEDAAAAEAHGADGSRGGTQSGDGETAVANGDAAAAASSAGVRRAERPAGSGIVSSALEQGEQVAFCMCNPPFFASAEEASANPATAYGGTAEEMVYPGERPGGELAFVTAMIEDSLKLRGQVHWYTTMVGKKATLKAARTLLYRHGVRVLRTTEFAQGKTSRWGLAWSFAADPTAASAPLPRFPAASTGASAGRQEASQGRDEPQRGQQRQRAADAPALRPTRRVSCQVQGAAAAGGAMLEAVEQSLRQQGLDCRLNKASFTMRATYQPSAEEAAEAAEAASRAAKRPRQPAQQGGSGGAPPGPWAAELQLFMQHAGMFVLTATLDRATPDAAQRWFAGVMGGVRRALATRWKVSA
eukprot:scaffold4.g5035.t1